ncbi:MAG: LLM class F420-dependent oxidoreductase [Sphingomonadales bacterium]|nr:LLM class F420-dependent oxidoreductase [Sphingomonadales bacterium]
MAFTLSVTFPFDHVQHGDEFISMAAVHACAKAADAAGFWSGTVTDHPVPSYRWLDNGGHYAQDPFVMLSMAAAVTTKLRLQTNIVVLPYRNPFITARAVSSLDAFSGGRFVFGMGAGYLKPEYKALGVDFDSRNDLMDEYIRAMKLAWTGEDFSFEGTGYTAVGNRVLPTPAQRPHPPLLIGGNSKRALRRTVELGDAWHPFIVPKMVTDTARTANISDSEDIVAAMDYMAEHCVKVGRATPPQVIASSTFSVKQGFNPQEALDQYAELHRIGVAGSGTSIWTDNRSEWCDLAQQFGEQVIARIDF